MAKEKYDETQELRSMLNAKQERINRLETDNVQLKEMLDTLIEESASFKASVSEYLVAKALLTHKYTTLDRLLFDIKRKTGK